MLTKITIQEANFKRSLLPLGVFKTFEEVDEIAKKLDKHLNLILIERENKKHYLYLEFSVTVDFRNNSKGEW